MNRKSIIMIGPFPPPIGGVSVHTSRLVNKIEKRYTIYKIDTSRNRLLQGLILLKLLIKSITSSSKFIVHNHVFKIKSNVIIVVLCKVFGVKYIQTIHSFRLNKDLLSNNEVGLIKFNINNTANIIVVSNKIKDDLIKYDSNVSKNIAVIPAFIPYGERITQITSEKYIDDLGIKDFIESHEIIICANAYKIVFFNDEDLYGIDLCIELMESIKKITEYNVGFIFMLPQISNLEYYNQMRNNIREKGIENDFLFVNKEVDMVPLFDFVDVFLRPTNTDGDALSIREALHSGIPCIASDVVERPVGAVTFKNRNASDLYKKVITLIQNLEEEKSKVKNLKNSESECMEKYYKLYDEIN